MAKKRIDERLLIEAALSEFSTYSFEESSVNRIIEKAGITKGSFYYRFNNKYELYLYLLKLGNRKKWEFINSDPEINSNSAKDIFELFQSQAESGVRFALAHPQYYKLSKMFSKEKGTALYSRVLNDLNATDEAGLKKRITKAYKDGNFNTDFSLPFIEKTISSLFLSFDEILFRGEDFELDKAISFLKEFVQFLKYGLKKT